MEFDLLTIFGILVMATLATTSWRLHVRSMRRAAEYDVDYVQWSTVVEETEELSNFNAAQALVRQRLSGPLGQVVNAKVEFFPAPDQYEMPRLGEKLQAALMERGPEAELDSMVRLSMYLVVGNILGTLGTSAFLHNAVVFSVGLAGILLNLGSLGRVERLRGMVTRATALLGRSLLTNAAQPRDDSQPTANSSDS